MSLILVVDDEPDMRLALATVLRKEGHAILEAGDGETAIEEIERQPVELVLLDIRLPGIDGIQVLKRLRQSRASLPIVMVTGYGSVDTAVKLMQSGADAYLSKPFSNRQLVETVEKILEARRLSMHPLHRGLAEKLAPSRPTLEEAPPAPPALRFPGSGRGGAGSGWRPGVWAGAAALAITVLAGVGVYRTFFAAPTVQHLAVPFSNPTALDWVQGRLWAADWVTQAVFQLEPKDGALLATHKISLPGSHITGMAVLGGFVYTCDSWKRTIQMRAMDETLTLLSEAKSPGKNPSALYSDGKVLWSCDASLARIYQHDPKSLAVLASYPSPGKTPVGLYKDQDYLWSADADTRQLYRHRLDEKLTVLDTYDAPELNEGSDPVSAITSDGSSWWVGRDGRNMLLKFNARALRHAH